MASILTLERPTVIICVLSNPEWGKDYYLIKPPEKWPINMLITEVAMGMMHYFKNKKIKLNE